MTDSLQEIFARQLKLQIESYGADPGMLQPGAQVEYVRWNVLALEDELHEALGEVSWKPWATGYFFHRDEYKKELVDALHFLVNLCLAGNITAEELFAAYKVKAETNARRQEQGYDAVSTKCPSCKRELDNPEALELEIVAVSKSSGEKLISYSPVISCSFCGYKFSDDEIRALQAAGVSAP